MRKMFSEKDFDRLVTTFEVVDVENLPRVVAESLKCGDVVIKATEDGKKHAYHVAYHTEDEMSLVYVDSEGIEECYYERQKSS